MKDHYAGQLDYEYTLYFTFAHIQGRQPTCFLICQKLLVLALWWTLFKECLQTLHNYNLTWDLPIAVLPSRAKPLSIMIKLRELAVLCETFVIFVGNFSSVCGCDRQESKFILQMLVSMMPVSANVG